MKKIYIADDEKNIRDIIALFLRNDGFIVETFANGDELKKVFDEEPSDLVILDIMMPGTDGVTLCNEIRQKSNVPIIIVSAKDTELDRITGITMGADDYLVKPFSPMELVARIKGIFRRINCHESVQEEKHLQFGDITLDISTRTCKLEDSVLDLTPTEFALMAYMFKHQEKAISRDELLKNVWKFDFDVCTRATDDVLKRLRKKLLSSNVRISSVWGYGFKLELVQDIV